MKRSENWSHPIPSIGLGRQTTTKLVLSVAHIYRFCLWFKYGPTNVTLLSEACFVVNVLDSKVKKEILSWFVRLQLSEYVVLFAVDQDVRISFGIDHFRMHILFSCVLLNCPKIEFYFPHRLPGWIKLIVGMHG